MSSIENKKVGEVMHYGVITITEDTPAKNICMTMAENNISSVVVKNAKGNISGIVSDTNILKIFEKCSGKWIKPEECPVNAGDIMTKKIANVKSSDSLKYAIELMDKNKIHRVLVLSNDNPEGVFSASDIRKELAKTSDKTPEAFYSRFENYEKQDTQVISGAVSNTAIDAELRKKKIYDVMTSGIIMVPITMGIKEVSKILSEKNIHGVSVITDEGEMIGIVSDVDIIKAFTGEFIGRDPSYLIAGDIMTTGVESATHCMTLEEGVGIMNEKHIHRLVVLFGRACDISQGSDLKKKPIMSQGIVRGVNVPVGILSASNIVREIAKR